MKIQKVLVVYKKSAYEIHALGRRHPFFRRFKLSHKLHYETLKEVRRALEEERIAYRALYRSASAEVSSYDLVVSVGGDGTFLETARRLDRQTILGVNSDPEHSVGSFCAARRGGFRKMLKAILNRKVFPRRINRLGLRMNGRLLRHRILNDILFCHENPAAMSRYWIGVGRHREEQRSSGLWISTAAGSTGAIKSAGGRALPWGSRWIQYWPRELYKSHGWKYRLTGGVLKEGQKLFMGSMIREGRLYLDGPHISIRFAHGDKLEVFSSSFPLNAILPPGR